MEFKINRDNKSISDSLVINKTFYESLKSQYSCYICGYLLNNPKMCSECETTFCKECLEIWLVNNETCPNSCQKQNITIKDLCKSTKNFLNELKLRCKYWCEVPLTSYYEHLIQCEEKHIEDEKCWNCENTSKKSSMKVRNEEIVNKIKEKNENLRDKYIEEKKLKELMLKDLNSYREKLKLKNEKNDIDNKISSIKKK